MLSHSCCHRWAMPSCRARVDQVSACQEAGSADSPTLCRACWARSSSASNAVSPASPWSASACARGVTGSREPPQLPGVP
jgi:hypothetical protein